MKKVLFILMCGLALSSTVNAQAPDTLHFDRLTLTGPGDDGGNEYLVSIHLCDATNCSHEPRILMPESKENVTALRNEAFSQIAKGKTEEGIRLLDSVYTLHPDSSIYFFKALAYAEKGDYGRARKSLNMMKATYSTKNIDDAKGRAFLSLFLKGKKKGLKCIRKLDPSAAERFNDMLEESCSPKEVYSAFFESIFGAYR